MNKNINEFTMVIIAPNQIGIPNNILRAIDDPMTSYFIYSFIYYLNVTSYNSNLCHQPEYYPHMLWVLFST